MLANLIPTVKVYWIKNPYTKYDNGILWNRIEIPKIWTNNDKATAWVIFINSVYDAYSKIILYSLKAEYIAIVITVFIRA